MRHKTLPNAVPIGKDSKKPNNPYCLWVTTAGRNQMGKNHVIHAGLRFKKRNAETVSLTMQNNRPMTPHFKYQFSSRNVWNTWLHSPYCIKVSNAERSSSCLNTALSESKEFCPCTPLPRGTKTNMSHGQNHLDTAPSRPEDKAGAERCQL